jgi:hypothetical protein
MPWSLSLSASTAPTPVATIHDAFAAPAMSFCYYSLDRVQLIRQSLSRRLTVMVWSCSIVSWRAGRLFGIAAHV